MTNARPIPRWNITFGVDVLSPRADAFLAEVEAACRNHGLVLAHEAGPGLIVRPFDEALAARLRNVRLATSAALKVAAGIVEICRSNGLAFSHEADESWSLAPKESPGKFVLAAWSEERAFDLRNAMIRDEVECFVYAGEVAAGGPG